MFILDPVKGLFPLEMVPYESEDFLQGLLAAHPDLLGNDRQFRLVLVSREVSVPDAVTGKSRWSLDHLYIDQDGVPTLVETKKASNTQIRREVVGQMLDYAANAVEYWSVETIRTAFAGTCAADGGDELQSLRAAFGDDVEFDTFWDRVGTNLQAGRVRMLFVADVIPFELRAIVEFLNEQMSPAEVLAIEVGQYVGEGVRALVPTTIGATRKAHGIKSASQTAPLPASWDEALEWAENEDIKPLIREEVARRRTNCRVRKIYYDCQGTRRWRLQVQKHDVNVYQSMRFAEDLQFWRRLFPGVQLRTPENATALSFNLATEEDLQRFLGAIEREGPSLSFRPAGEPGETASAT